MEKYLYFRNVADEANDGVTGLKTDNPSSFLFPASALTAMQPVADGILALYFTPRLNSNTTLRDRVTLNITQGDHFEIMRAITDAIASPSRGHSDGFITIADDMTTTDALASPPDGPAANTVVPAEYIHNSIVAVREIIVQAPSLYGYHEHYEVIDLPAGAVADDAVIAASRIYIPAEAVIVEAGITNVELDSSADASCALEVHNDADTGASAGTEIIGAGAGGGSLPNTDLNFGTGDVVGETITAGTLCSHESPLDRGTAPSYFHIVAKEGSMTLAATPKIGLKLSWYGPAAIEV